MKFQKKVRVPFSRVDAAGIVFFAHYFTVAHDAYEEFLRELGYPWEVWFENGSWLAPLRHVECDYFKPLVGGKEYTLEISVAKIGNTSYEMRYVYLDGTEPQAETRHVHAFMDRNTKKKMPIPDDIRGKLEKFTD
jgi:acyl-CoA thioester hydrolase/1,4-dihydroxy-2-naphthoyl-CoA hydrolase